MSSQAGELDYNKNVLFTKFILSIFIISTLPANSKINIKPSGTRNLAYLNNTS